MKFGNIRGIVGDKRGLLNEWHIIMEKVNFVPIFAIASEILLPIQNKIAKKIILNLIDAAGQLDEIGVTSRHDICGRMFQKLITDREFLATYYTLPTSATFLSELAVERMSINWSEKNEVSALKIADFACGTGALLNSAYHVILSRHNRAGGDDSEIHKYMMENSIVGTDIMPAATHLTASMLAGAHPGVTFNRTSIYTLPYGKDKEEKKCT